MPKVLEIRFAADVQEATKWDLIVHGFHALLDYYMHRAPVWWDPAVKSIQVVERPEVSP